MTWLLKPGDGLLLSGPSGTGKTWSAAALTRTLIEAERPVVWLQASDFFRSIRENHRLPGCSERDTLNHYGSAEILIVDDLGAGAGSDFERRCILELFEQRLNSLRPTIVTTNWTLEQITEQFDDRLASRLSAFTRVQFTGPDVRLNA